MRDIFEFLPFNYFDFKRSGHIKNVTMNCGRKKDYNTC